MKNPQETVKDLGEQGLLALIQAFCPPGVVGDDAALLTVPTGQSLVVTTDVLVEQVHFSQQTTEAEDVGWRAAAANLSDLAAMGASPLGITVGLSLPAATPSQWVEQLYQGLNSCLESYQTPILGGDLCRSSVITIAITALGQVHPQQVIRRDTARPGDLIVVTGSHGGSRAGLELLLNPDRGEQLTKVERAELKRRHQRPRPQLDCLPYLKSIFQNNWRVAGMDSSDGLADAVIQICRCSGVGGILEREAITYPVALDKICSPQQALEWALYGGEDFELVLCLPPQLARELVRVLGGAAAIVGEIINGAEVYLRDSQGEPTRRQLTLSGGFQHF